jgi:Outer membrane protein beta-barrel domain
MRAFHQLIVVPALAGAALLVASIPASAQVGVGGHLAFVKADTNGDDDSRRFIGGHVRLTGERAGLEVSLDRHTEELEALDQRVKETPIQASLMLFLARGSFKPYLLGGPGWYRTRVEAIDDSDNGTTTKEFGWHGGFGAEIRGGRHFGFHADYRYTFLDFNDDDDDDDDGGLIGGLLPSHKGSMWTVGATVYF